MTDRSAALPQTGTSPHARAIAAELDWLGRVIEARLTHFFAGEDTPFALPAAPVPVPGSALGRLAGDGALTPEARLVLALAIAPHVNSAILDPFFVRNAAIDLAAARDHGVTVCGTASGGTPTAELVFAHMLEFARKVGFENARMKSGAPWQVTIGRELNGKTLGVLGLG